MKPLITVALVLVVAGCTSHHATGPAAVPDFTDPAVQRQDAPYLEKEYAAMRARQISGVDYTLSIELSREGPDFSGVLDAAFDLAEGNRAPVTVDFAGGDVGGVVLNGRPVDFEYNGRFITLIEGLSAGERNRLEIRYTHPYVTDGDGLHRYVDPQSGKRYLYTNFEPFNANKLFPHFDQPDIKAAYTLDVLAPGDWRVISAVREERVVEAGDKRHWYFPQSPRISSYIFPLHAGPYHMWTASYESPEGDIPMRLFARPELADHVVVEDWFTFTRQSFGFFNDYFELFYPFGKYDQVIVPDFNAGAMENLAAVTFTERFVSRGEKTEGERIRLANVIAHEMAHMWFGNLVTMDWWNGLWLNESFATYMAYLELARAGDFSDTWDVFYSRTKQWAYQTDQQVTTHPIELPVPTTSDAFTNFDGITYGKGASVLKQLPHFLGEENFRRGVANYLKEHAYGNTALEDFIAALGETAGRDLDDWTRQWLYRAGLNSLRAEYDCDRGLLSELTLHQSAPPNHPVLRAQRVQVGLYALDEASGEPAWTLAKLPVTYRGATTAVDIPPSTPCPDLVYPNAGDWGYVKVILDERSRDTLLTSIKRFENDSLRIMLWQSLWDGVRDVRMPLDAFIAFVETKIAAESDKRIVSQIARQLSQSDAYLRLIGPDDYAGLLESISGLMWARMNAAPAGSDQQKTWFDRWAGVAAGENDLERARDLLAGKRSIAGLTLDQDRRWLLVIALNRSAYGDYQRHTREELERDGSDRGRLNALAAEAVRPDTAIKAKWLNVMIDQPGEYKLAELTSVMRHLFPAGQSGLLEQYAGRILGALPDLARERDDRFLQRYAYNLLPATCRPASVKRLESAIERYSGLNPAVDKALRITHQDDERCVAIGRLLASGSTGGAD